MIINFYKYHGAGNDFVLIDNRNNAFSVLTQTVISHLCNRHIGIGADGLMFLEKPIENEDFFMKYFNSDGRESTMCGNGGRCISAFAHNILTTKNSYNFRAIDGLHAAEIIEHCGNKYIVRLKMIDVNVVEKCGNDYLLNAGSPHLVRFTDNINTVEFLTEARALRYQNIIGDGGTNVNFVQIIQDSLLIRTYERGVEDETLSCGTGSVAAAIAAQYKQNMLVDGQKYQIKLYATGGMLNVDFVYRHGVFTEVFLTGEAYFVFNGTLSI